MVLLTAVPVSPPAAMATGVMVVFAPGTDMGAAAAAVGAPSGAVAIGAAPTGVGASAMAPGMPNVESALGGTASSAAMSLVSSPNMLSISEQAETVRLVASDKARTRPVLRLIVDGNPLISALRCRRRRPRFKVPPRPTPPLRRPRTQERVASSFSDPTRPSQGPAASHPAGIFLVLWALDRHL